MFKTYAYLALAAFSITACHVIPEDTSQYADTVYQNAPSHSVMQASYEPVSCPQGTTPHSSGTCLLNDSSTSKVYQNAPSHSVMQASYKPVSCPQGTTPHSSGSCLLDDPNTSLQSETFQGTSRRVIQSTQQYAPAQSASNVIRATTVPAAPSAYLGTEIKRAYGGANYRVKSGDTVYSLARNLCVPVTAIQTSNGLDSNYGIQIGQTLKLPGSQC